MTRFIALMSCAGLLLGACGEDEPELAATPDETIASEPFDNFDTLDANSDSYLDADEVAEYVDDEALFNEWDIDADSELDQDELVGNAFESWDADANGAISQDEWEAGATRLYPGDTGLNIFSDIDGDGDSELDRDEVKERFDISLFGESWNAESLSEDSFRTAYFELYDHDDDGRVDETEWSYGARVFGTPDE